MSKSKLARYVTIGASALALWAAPMTAANADSHKGDMPGEGTTVLVEFPETAAT